MFLLPTNAGLSKDRDSLNHCLQTHGRFCEAIAVVDCDLSRAWRMMS
jgi:hypothetical protein